MFFMIEVPFYMICTLFVVLLFLFIYALVWKKLYKKEGIITIGFFHPFCNSGGGGERVLWSAIKVIQDTYENVTCIIYTGDTEVSMEEILKNVENRFTIKIDHKRTQLVYLRARFLLLDKCYPIFTLLGQSLGSMIVAFEALLKYIPDIFFETTGYAFTYPIFKYIANVPVCCYVHYPTISIDMLKKVSNRQESFNNRQIIGKSKLLTRGKLIYYQIFTKLYSLSGRCSSCIMVNSTWTLTHINSLWSSPYKTKVVYPPCDVEQFLSILNAKRDDNFIISSVAQFRPEKNHQLQVRSFAKFLDKLGNAQTESIKLFLIGSCRNNEDTQRVEALKDLCAALKLTHKVEFKINQSFSQLKSLLSESAVGLHSMKDEHFGIGVVECMAAGCIIVAHNSAGPKEDIVISYNGERTGFLAETEDDYAECFMQIFNLSLLQRNNLRKVARKSVERFSQQQFNINVMNSFNLLCLSNFNVKKYLL